MEIDHAKAFTDDCNPTYRMLKFIKSTSNV